MNIYELTANEMNIEKFIDAETGEFDAEAYEQNSTDLNEKRIAYIKVIKNKKANIEALKNEIASLKERVDREARTVDRMTEAMNYSLTQGQPVDPNNKPSFECQYGVVSYRKSNRVEFVVDEAQFIDWASLRGKSELLSVKTSANKTAIKEALKNGEDVPAFVTEVYNIGIK